MKEITTVSGSCIPVRGDDIDTDRIIPARFMKGITFDDLGQYAFYDARRDGEGALNDHPFNDSRFSGASILLVNRNFGCGSSREHAPQALIRSGIRAIIGESFAEIFAGNCTANGLPVATLEPDAMSALMEYAEAHPDEIMELDVDDLSLTGSSGKAFLLNMDGGRRRSLLDGSWDTLGEMLGNLELTKALSKRLSAGVV